MNDPCDAFEAWFTDGVVGAQLARKDGDYVIMSAHISWIAWQAATLAERERNRRLAEDYDTGIDAANAIRSKT